MARLTKLTSFMLFWIVVFSSQGFAFLRFPLQDAEVVGRSKLIVIGHLDKDSIKHVLHNTGARGKSWEYHAVITVTEVLRGDTKLKKIPIVILHGMDIKVGGNFFHRSRGLTSPGNPKDAIEIWDTGNSALSPVPTVKDAGKDLIWFLWDGVRSDRTVADKSHYGISSPEVMQPLELKDYFVSHLSENPEKAVREYARKNLEVKERAERYLDHVAIQRIVRQEDNTKIVEQLMPYYLGKGTSYGRYYALGAIRTCGEAAGPYMVNMFKTTDEDLRRTEIIQMFARIKYKQSADLLINLLEENDKYWAKQKLQKDWWNGDKNTDRNRSRRQIYGETYYSVHALAEIGDLRAVPAIELTKKRWEAIQFENPQIVEGCRDALEKFEKIKAGKYEDRTPISIKTHEIIRLLEKESVEWITTHPYQMVSIKIKDNKRFYRGRYLHFKAGKYSKDKDLDDIQKIVKYIKNNRSPAEVIGWKIGHHYY